jgi:hypothetical protein
MCWLCNPYDSYINRHFAVKCINRLVFVMETRYVFCEVRVKVPLYLKQHYEIKSYRVWRCSSTHSEPYCLEVHGKVHAPASVPRGKKKRLHFPLNRTLAGRELLDVLESGCYCYQVETELFTDENAGQTL